MSLPLAELPAPLQAPAARAWEALCEAAGGSEAGAAFAADPARGRELARVLACSPWAAAEFARRPALLAALRESGELWRSLPADAWDRALATAPAADAVAAPVALRRLRRRAMLRILWRDFNGLADTAETMRDTSLLAEACIRHALAHCRAELEARFGRPRGRRSGEHQELIVIAMGKLGAGELNLSSDIDLVFAYPEAGETDGTERTLSNEEFFTRLGRALIAALDPVTAEGFVFRVDMRLRPYGESGPLAHSFAALEAYYQDQGRDWERYALIKARPLTGDPARCAELMGTLRPFVFRRYVDFGVIESLRGMKRMIGAEVARRGLEDNVKLGRGGIREVEFVAQCLQLIRGGRDRALQQRELLPVLASCAELGCLPAAAVTELRDAYLFLRDSEHAIQGYEDRQTQELPTVTRARAALALVLGCADWESYRERLELHRSRVARHFDDLIAPAEEAAETAPLGGLPFRSVDDATLAALGFRTPAESRRLFADLQDGSGLRAVQVEGRERLEQFMPRLLEACAADDDPDLTLARILPLLRAVLRRSAYLVLLMENPPALGELVSLCGTSPWIAQLLASHPALLDELLDESSLYSAPDRERLRQELAQQLDRLELSDLEAQMDALRYFKAAHILRVAASERLGRLPLMQVSDKLTFIADVVLEQVLAVAWAALVERYGEPARDGDDTGFVLCAYGKLGGIELGYGSDLDLVFVYDAAPQGATNGGRSIENSVFYTRLGQKIIHILETRTALGQLYEVDMRLRPSGASGLLVSSLAAFAAYQRDRAWTWEHQALVRARPVAGDRRVGAALTSLRREILCRERDRRALAADVVAMRRRMREHLLPARLPPDRFELKQSPGGIVDIEFMVQYAVLAWSHGCPELARWSDNIRLLETLGRAGHFPQTVAAALIDAYIAYRSASHRLALQQAPGEVSLEAVADHRAAVLAQWRVLFAGAESGAEASEGDRQGTT